VRAWLTQNDIPATRTDFVLTLPSSWEWRAQFLGAFLLLTKPENWELFGTLTPQEMADEWLELFLLFEEEGQVLLPIGTILPFAGQTAPSGYLLCHGQTVLRADYPDLFAVVGTLYGASVSGTEFNIPDLRQSVPVGVDEAGPAGFDIGDVGGEITHTLTVSEMPAHKHATRTAYAVVVGGAPGDSIPAGSGGALQDINQMASVGGGASHNNMPPYLAINYIIKF